MMPTGQLTPKGSGGKDRPIVIDKFGGAARPVLDGGGSSDDGGFYGAQGKTGSVVYLFNHDTSSSRVRRASTPASRRADAPRACTTSGAGAWPPANPTSAHGRRPESNKAVR